MKFPEFEHDYKGAAVRDFRSGPRRELTLFILPPKSNGGSQNDRSATFIRFGGVRNLEEVEQFFAHNLISPHLDEIWEIEFLGFDSTKSSKPNDLFLRFAFERTDASISIHCQNVTEGNTDSESTLQTNTQ